MTTGFYQTFFTSENVTSNNVTNVTGRTTKSTQWSNKKYLGNYGKTKFIEFTLDYFVGEMILSLRDSEITKTTKYLLSLSHFSQSF